MLDSKEGTHDKKKHFITALQKASIILYEIQRYAAPDDFEKLPDWLDKIIKCCE